MGYATIRAGVGTRPLGALLPPAVVAVEAVGDVTPDAFLDGEAALVTNAVESRRLEVARGRSCARRALAELGVAPVPILAESRAPIWPAGIVGSITHCAGYVCAAVARATECTTVGLDAEIVRPLESGVERQIATAAELAALPAGPQWSCVLFSAKEALYKAWYPLARRWLDFHDVTMTIDPAGRFEATTLVEGPARWPRVVTGLFAFDADRVIAVVAL